MRVIRPPPGACPTRAPRPLCRTKSQMIPRVRRRMGLCVWPPFREAPGCAGVATRTPPGRAPRRRPPACEGRHGARAAVARAKSQMIPRVRRRMGLCVWPSRWGASVVLLHAHARTRIRTRAHRNVHVSHGAWRAIALSLGGRALAACVLKRCRPSLLYCAPFR